MWKSKRNVSITYTPLPNATKPPSRIPSSVPRLDDLVSYQTLNSQKVKTVEGIDTPTPPNRGEGGAGGEWDWRGKGWLRVARSHWEVLGWGDISAEMDGEEKGGGKRMEGNQWAVTYFAKTLFTPAGIDVYSRRKEGVGDGVVEGIQEALGRSEDEGVRKLAGEVFESPLQSSLGGVCVGVVDVVVEVGVVEKDAVVVARVVGPGVMKQEQAEDTLDAGYAETYVGRGWFGGGRV
ncbi:MAG: hypothetical protein Q9179_002926 [Wetmoreana sp. 5 TL-2023]